MTSTQQASTRISIVHFARLGAAIAMLLTLNSVNAFQVESTETRATLGTVVRGVTKDQVVQGLVPVKMGCIVDLVLPGMAAEKAGIQENDVILLLDGTPVESMPQFAKAIHAKRPGDTVQLNILRTGQEMVITAVLDLMPSPAEFAVKVREKADAGVAAAQAKMGNIYWQGEGVEKDLRKAAEWFQLAANQNDMTGFFGLAIPNFMLALKY